MTQGLPRLYGSGALGTGLVCSVAAEPPEADRCLLGNIEYLPSVGANMGYYVQPTRLYVTVLIAQGTLYARRRGKGVWDLRRC